MGVITALEVQKRNKERVNVYLDGDYAFSLTLIEAARLRKGQTLNAAEIEALRDQDAIIKAVDQGARFLGYRPRSVSEVRRNLSSKQIPDAVIDAALSRLEAMGYLDDHAFARYWLENRTQFKPRGAMALRYELRQKGVTDAIIDSVLEALDESEAALHAASQKASRYSGLTRREFEKKLGSFLQRRGFSYATSRDVIEQIAAERASENADFFIEADEDEDEGYA